MRMILCKLETALISPQLECSFSNPCTSNSRVAPSYLLTPHLQLAFETLAMPWIVPKDGVCNRSKKINIDNYVMSVHALNSFRTRS
jgi:hypothetical protein